MNYEFSNKTSTATSVIIGLVFALIGLFSMIAYNLWIGLVAVSLGIVLFFLIRYLGNDTTVSCHENGFTVTVINKRKGTTVNEYTWKDVTDTLYYEKGSGGEDSTTTCYFQVKTTNGIAFTLSQMREFHMLIKLFNQHTSHLPYIWEKSKKKIKSSSYYQKANRFSS